MNSVLLAQIEQSTTLTDRVLTGITAPISRIVCASILLGVALVLLLPGKTRQRKWVGGGTGVLGIGLVWSLVPLANSLSFQTAFWFMASIAVIASTATVTSRSPVYSAIWFAVSLLGIAGLFLLQGAQFLGVATVAVYAGAIVVTFLFVLMLAQPEGLSFYDRITWGTSTRTVIPFISAALMGLLANAIVQTNTEHATLNDVVNAYVESLAADRDLSLSLQRVRVRKYQDDIAEIHIGIDTDEAGLAVFASARDPLKQQIAESIPRLSNSVIKLEQADDIQHAQHVAHLGGNLFGRYLIAIQIAGCLLLVALVGAVAIASHGSGEAKLA